MDNSEVKQKVLEIMDNFGMSGVKAAEAMSVTHATFRKKKDDNDTRHTFNEKNLRDLNNYIQEKALFTKAIMKEMENRIVQRQKEK